MYDKETLIPSIHGSLYGNVLLWKEPIQSTLEPLALGIRLSFATGNVQFAMVNTIYYLARSFNCGKNTGVLAGEVGALARQHENHFGLTSMDASCTSPDKPLYNPLCALEGREDDDEDFPFFLDKVQFANNEDILNAALKMEQLACTHTILSYETARAFVSRDMDDALRFTNLYFTHFLTNDKGLSYTSIYNVFYEALINFHFMRLKGEDRYMVRAEAALQRMKEWVGHSDWNFANKLLLVEAEWHYTKKDLKRAAVCYEAAAVAARNHKFIHEEAIACELAGIFFVGTGNRPRANSFYLRSVECFNKWGAFAVAKRVECIILSTFGAGSIEPESIADPCSSSLCAPEEVSSKKRQSQD